MIAPGAWDGMLDEFRALGGIAENICLGAGSFGRGLFPIDPTKPINISIPEELLVPLDAVAIENDAFRVKAASPISERGRAFLEQYERDFSWGPGHHEVESFLEAMHQLPERIRDLLTKKFGAGRFFVPTTINLVKTWFFGMRMINARGQRQVIMPIIELANHGGNGSYDTESGVALTGKFDGEVLVRYMMPTDPLDMFLNWMFAPREPMAFSTELVTTFGGKQFEVQRKFHDDSRTPSIPNVTVDGDRIVVQYLLLGHQNFPRVPKGIFRHAMQEAGLKEADELYDFVQFANRQDFLDLLDALEGVDLSIIPTLRALALSQLRALSCHFGVRQV
jgi:hypothetical protein